METLMYFWLNYSDGNIERIPVAVKNIDRYFRTASEILESLNTFQTVLESMIMNTWKA